MAEEDKFVMALFTGRKISGVSKRYLGTDRRWNWHFILNKRISILGASLSRHICLLFSRCLSSFNYSSASTSKQRAYNACAKYTLAILFFLKGEKRGKSKVPNHGGSNLIHRAQTSLSSYCVFDGSLPHQSDRTL